MDPEVPYQEEEIKRNVKRARQDRVDFTPKGKDLLKYRRHQSINFEVKENREACK